MKRVVIILACLASLISPAFAADSTVPAMGNGTAVAGTDGFYCIQSAGTTEHECTATQLNTFASGHRLNVLNFGAKCDSTTDDSTAINATIDAVIAQYSAGTPLPDVVYIPGVCKYVTPHATMLYPVSFIGDGHQKSVILVDKTLSGTVFAWSDVWQGGAQTGTTFSLFGGSPPNRSGVIVSGLSIVGDTSTANTQNAFIFYDRADFVLFNDVQVWYMKGRGLYSGVLLNTTQSYMRESHFQNVRFNSCGTTSTPVVEFSSEGTGGTDATNEVQFYNLNVIGSNGPPLVIRNDSASTVRYVNFYGLRLETSSADNLMTIGDGTFAGGVNSINVYGFQAIGAPSGKSAIATLAPNSTAANLIFNINVDGFITNSAGGGINVQAGRALWFKIWEMSTTGTNFTVGAASLGIGKVTVDTNDGAQSSWTASVDATSAANVQSPTLHQFP